jgi:folate-binding protein YgfZ
MGVAGWTEADRADYEALRHGLGAFPAPRDVLAMTGPDALDYLQGQCSQDLAALADGQAAEALLLAPEGKVDALVRVVRVGPEHLLVDTDAGFGELVAARLARFKLRSRFELEALGWSCLSLRGPAVKDLDAKALSSGEDTVAVAVGWPEPGIDVLGADARDLVVPAARRCGATAVEARRVELGQPAMGRELDASTIPAEAHLLGRAVSFEKGCYTGQELVARLDARGNKVARSLRGVVVHEAPDPAALEGAALVVAGRERPVGSVTSAAYSPGLGAVAALGYVHRSVSPPAPCEVVGPAEGHGAPERHLSGEVRSLPLVGD